MNSESQIYQNLMHNSSLYMALKTGVSLIDFSIWSIELIFHVISLKFLRLRQCTYYLVKNWLDRKWEACAEERGAHSSISEWKQISLLFEKLKQYDHYVKLNFLAYSAISEAFIMIRSSPVSVVMDFLVTGLGLFIHFFLGVIVTF